MAASVQELILAAQAKQKKSPLSMLADLVNAGVEGYGKGVQLVNVQSETELRRAQIAKALVEKQQAEQDMAAQQDALKQFQDQIALQSEQNLRQNQSSVAGTPLATNPAGKFEQTLTQNAQGRVSRSIKLIPPKQPEAPTTIEAGLMDKVNKRELSIEQAIKMKSTPQLDRPMQMQIAKAKVELADTRPMVDSVIKEIDRVQLLNKDSYGGYVGAAKMKTISALNAGENNRTFKNTADVVNTMQAQVVKVLKSSFGGQLSDGERQYLNQVYGALPNMSTTERDIAMTNVKTMLTNRLRGAESKLNELSVGAGIDSSPVNPDTQSPVNPDTSETPEQRKARLIKELKEAKP